MKSNLLLRSITGILFVVVLVAAIVSGPYSFGFLFAIVTGLTTWEFCSILNKNQGVQINKLITTAAAVIFFFSVYGFYLGVWGVGIFVPLCLSILYLFISELYTNSETPIQNWAYALMALLYIALPFSLLSILTIEFFPVPGTGLSAVAYRSIFALSIFIFLWSSDTGAYIFGVWLGKHRLFPRISPKKSWEGSVGGTVVALAASQIIAIWSNDFAPNDAVLNRLYWAGLAFVVVVFGTWGDLVESLLKRKLGIKDSGNILPGHGGMLDRFDSSLVAIPAAVVYIYSISLI